MTSIGFVRYVLLSTFGLSASLETEAIQTVLAGTKALTCNILSIKRRCKAEEQSRVDHFLILTKARLLLSLLSDLDVFQRSTSSA